MNSSSISRASKQLSWLLRHGANEAGVTMDAAGWVAIADVLRVLRIAPDDFNAAVRENNKTRFELASDRVRASQGHSLAGTPVTLDALEASWERVLDDSPVFHGTSVAAAESIAREGIHPGERTHVHLAAAVDSRVGKRAGVDVLLEVSPARMHAHGLALYRSPNGVILARRVPPECIGGVHASSAAGRAAQARLTSLLSGGASH